MRYYFYILQVLLLLILSCAPKPPPMPVKPPGPVIPSWIDGKPEDSLYIYGISRIDIGHDEPGKLKDLAYRKISEIIHKRLKKRLKLVSDSTGANFSGYADRIIESRISRSLNHMEIAERYKDKKYEHVLARLDKRKYINNILNDKREATTLATSILSGINNEISTNNFTKIQKAVDTISMFFDYYPVLDDTTKYKNALGIVDVARDLIRKYNERIFITFEPEFLETMPLINDNKRIRVSAKDQLTESVINDMWIETRFSDSEHRDLILTKSDGTTLYQTKSIMRETGSYVVSFEVGYKSMMDQASADLLYVKPNIFSLTVLLSAPKIYFENIIEDLDDAAPNSEVVDAIRKCFTDKYSAVFVDNKNESDILLSLDISTLEHKERVTDIYPYFVHAAGSISLTDTRTNERVFNHEISEQKGSDFNSIEKAGINSLKNLAERLGLEICG